MFEGRDNKATKNKGGKRNEGGCKGPCKDEEAEEEESSEFQVGTVHLQYMCVKYRGRK